MRASRTAQLERILADHPEGLTAGELSAELQRRYAVTIPADRIGEIADRSTLIWTEPCHTARTAEKRQAQRATAGTGATWPDRMAAYEQELRKITRRKVAGNARAFLYRLDMRGWQRRHPAEKPKPVKPFICGCGCYHNDLVWPKFCRRCGTPLPPMEAPCPNKGPVQLPLPFLASLPKVSRPLRPRRVRRPVIPPAEQQLAIIFEPTG